MENIKEVKLNKKPASNPSPSKSDPTKIILIAVIFLLLGAIGYLVFNGQQQEETISKQTVKVDSLTTQVNAKIKELEAYISRYDSLQKAYEAMGMESDELKKTIAGLEADVQRLRADKAAYNSIKAKYNNMEAQYIGSKRTIDSLVALNRSLELRGDSLVSVARVKDDTIGVLKKKNDEFAKKVALAAFLRAENIKIAVFSQKGKEEKFVPIYKAKSVGKIKVSFNLADNPVADHEEKDIYFRLIEPSGSTIFEGDKVFTVDGKESFYTDKQSINFNNTKQQVTFLYNKGSNYKPGKYNIELFADGRKIGETTLSLK